MKVNETVGVFHDHFTVGRINAYDHGCLDFVYDSRWLDTEKAFPLSITMPLENHEFPDEVISPWLTNLLPEDQLLSSIGRVLGVPKGDSLRILKEIGCDTAGAISIGEPSCRSKWEYTTLQKFYGLPSEDKALKRHFKDLELRPLLADEDGIKLSLAGGQEKTVLAVVDHNDLPFIDFPKPEGRLAIPMHGAPSTIIVKPDKQGVKGFVENEAYCLTLAGLVGIPAAKCAVIQANSRIALAILRFDRFVDSNGCIRRQHQEDFAQANGLLPSRKYEEGTVPGLTLKGLLSTCNSMPSGEELKLLDQVIYNILVGNTDAHAKNYSIRLSEKGATMAPMYDVLSAPFWRDAKKHHAQKIAGERIIPCNIKRRHWDQVAHDANLNSYQVRQRVRELIDSMSKAKSEAIQIVSDQPGVLEETVIEVADTVEKNATQIGEHLE